MLQNRIRQAIYAALTAIGFVLTNYYLVQFTIATKGELTIANFLNFDIALFIEQVFANSASSFIGMDVTIAALCAIVLIVTEGRRLKMRLWGLYIVVMFSVSFGFGFPLFLFMRERKQIKLLGIAGDNQKENISPT
ncbi:DUF2834 domain-containing protein [Pleurocapsa sp. FMAR1]|uniref:DUF2834 domain-containing protein n=1 Tax=Pleurocapsa sp. FMAR1 TaxID=3040204 RepID=UPI0029C71E46|nr:DUF2834 domain-containing protein [Pleurocapsa sp. FMAR1]